MAGDKTEAPTPKRLEEARKEGNIPRSMDLNGSAVMMAGLLVIGITGPSMVGHLREALLVSLDRIARPDVVSLEGLEPLVVEAGRHTLMGVAPVALACMLAGVAAAILSGAKPALGAAKPMAKRMSPLQGAKNLFGPHAMFEAVKNVLKVVAVGGVVFLAIFPQIPRMGALVGMEPQMLASQLAATVRDVSLKAGALYLVIGIADLFYQRWRHTKNLRMDKQEVKDEHKQQELPAEVRGAIRRRQMGASRARQMADVPNADVVITNPTHFAVALKYDGTSPAPVVVAKGQDLIALRIRQVATEAGVAIHPEPPLARSLYSSVEVGQQIPEELFQAVAQVLAAVFRRAGRMRARAA